MVFGRISVGLSLIGLIQGLGLLLLILGRE
jgi:hypothetical protein